MEWPVPTLADVHEARLRIAPHLRPTPLSRSDAAPAAFRSWRERRLVEDRMETCAEGLATRTAFELPQRILWRWLDDFELVSDDEILQAQAVMIAATRNLVEAAGAAPLAPRSALASTCAASVSR